MYRGGGGGGGGGSDPGRPDENFSAKHNKLFLWKQRNAWGTMLFGVITLRIGVYAVLLTPFRKIRVGGSRFPLYIMYR